MEGTVPDGNLFEKIKELRFDLLSTSHTRFAGPVSFLQYFFSFPSDFNIRLLLLLIR